MIHSFSCVTPDKAPRLLASKWLSCHLLLDRSEWESFFSSVDIETVEMYRASGLFMPSEARQSVEDFLIMWDAYQNAMTSDLNIDESRFRSSFSLYLTLSSHQIAGVGRDLNGPILIQPKGPCVTMQLHRFHATSLPQPKILSGVFGPHALHWGVTLSYPQIIQDGISREVKNALKDPQCVNSRLWRLIQHFAREKTVPTPFLVSGTSIWSQLRLGKNAARWIDGHQSLNSKKPDLLLDKERLSKAIVL